MILKLPWSESLFGFYSATKDERCDSIISGNVAFYTMILEQGVGLPLHPFFMNILDFYQFSYVQLTLVVWCHMMATLILYLRQDMGVPTMEEWRTFYRP